MPPTTPPAAAAGSRDHVQARSSGSRSRLLPPLVALLLLLAAVAPPTAATAATSRPRGPVLPLAFSSSPPSPTSSPPLIDRVPTFRLYQGGACVAQLRGGGEVQECRQRLHEAITGLLPGIAVGAGAGAVAPILELEAPAALDALLRAQEGGGLASSSSSSSSSSSPSAAPSPRAATTAAAAAAPTTTAGAGAKPVYKDRAALIQALMSQPAPSPPSPPTPPTPAAPPPPPPQEAAAAAAGRALLIVEFYGRNCKQCQLVDPMFAALPFAYRGRPLAFARADVTRFPALVVPPPDPQAFAGLDRSAGIEERLEGCPRCGGSGFVACEACGGQGHVVRRVEGHTVADVCMACVGHKKVPCPQCGGKCYLC